MIERRITQSSNKEDQKSWPLRFPRFNFCENQKTRPTSRDENEESTEMKWRDVCLDQRNKMGFFENQWIAIANGGDEEKKINKLGLMIPV